MADIVDSKTRSRMMSGIRGKNTKPEIIIRKGLFQLGFRYRLHDKKLIGKPDFVLRKLRAVIFIHACFWHKYNCHLFKRPKTRPEFWKNKIKSNHKNDLQAINAMQNSGWRVCIVWECALKGANRDIGNLLEKLANWLLSKNEMVEFAE